MVAWNKASGHSLLQYLRMSYLENEQNVSKHISKRDERFSKVSFMNNKLLKTCQFNVTYGSIKFGIGEKH